MFKLLLLPTIFLLNFVHQSTSNQGLVIGGFGATTIMQVVTADGVCYGNEATPAVPFNPNGRFGWTSQYIGGKVYLCGGSEFDVFNTCYSLVIGTSGWYAAGTMRFKRRYAESLVYNGEMIIMGGYNNNQGWLDSVEKVAANGEISELADWKLPRKIFDFCAVNMDDGRIMILGGNIEPTRHNRIFDSTDMDIFDPLTKTWSQGPPMAKRRATHDCIVTEYNGERGVMVSGGCNENCNFHLKDVDFFSFSSQTWTSLPPMNKVCILI